MESDKLGKKSSRAIAHEKKNVAMVNVVNRIISEAERFGSIQAERFGSIQLQWSSFLLRGSQQLSFRFHLWSAALNDAPSFAYIFKAVSTFPFIHKQMFSLSVSQKQSPLQSDRSEQLAIHFKLHMRESENNGSEM